jgi:DNA-binding response OmpR family regulator
MSSIGAVRLSGDVLVVDDEGFLTYERLLRREGFEVVRSQPARPAWRRWPPSCPTRHLDLRLPDGDGLDVVRAARGARPPMPIIVVTGYPSDETRRAALAAGATVFLAKPFVAAALLAAIRSNVDGHTESST